MYDSARPAKINTFNPGPVRYFLKLSVCPTQSFREWRLWLRVSLNRRARLTTRSRRNTPCPEVRSGCFTRRSRNLLLTLFASGAAERRTTVGPRTKTGVMSQCSMAAFIRIDEIEAAVPYRIHIVLGFDCPLGARSTSEDVLF